jgi:uncharacterized membrane protein YfcA
MALLFAATSIVTVFLTRQWLVPAIPAHIATIRGFVITENWLTMVLFALLMLISSISMMRNKTSQHTPAGADKKISLGKMTLLGTAIGLVTGLLGAGGGFLLIPALVLLLHLPMKEAIGTSLLVIALNSLIGFIGDLHNKGINWSLLLVVTTLAIVGILLGSYLNRRITSGKLKKAFSWFVLAMSIYILITEFTCNQ